MPDETTQAPVPLGTGIRNRVIERTKMFGRDIAPHPENWRVHPDVQKAGLRGILRDVGMVGEVYAYYSEKNGGKLTLIDGHLRSSDEFGDLEWDVAITDLDDAEAAKVLISRDNIAMLAQGSVENLESLIRQVQTEDQELATFIEETALDYGIVQFPSDPADGAGGDAQGGDDFPKFEDEPSTHVQCPSCQYRWALTAAEIAKFKLKKGKKAKKSKGKKGKHDDPQAAEPGEEDAVADELAELDDE